MHTLPLSSPYKMSELEIRLTDFMNSSSHNLKNNSTYSKSDLEVRKSDLMTEGGSHNL
jgi:hypothetical protein